MTAATHVAAAYMTAQRVESAGVLELRRAVQVLADELSQVRRSVVVRVTPETLPQINTAVNALHKAMRAYRSWQAEPTDENRERAQRCLELYAGHRRKAQRAEQRRRAAEWCAAVESQFIGGCAE